MNKGPWFVGEILEDHYGICFAWGIYVKNIMLNVDFQYVAGFFHVNNKYLVLFDLIFFFSY
jgi:hypothetical protein